MCNIYVAIIWSYENGNIYEKEFDGNLEKLQSQIAKDVIMDIRFEKEE